MVGIDVLAEQRQFAHPGLGKVRCFAQHLLQRPADLGAPRIRHDAERAELVAAFLDGKKGAVALRRGFFRQPVEFLIDGQVDGHDPRAAGFHQLSRGAAQQVRQVLVGLRPEHQVDGRRPAHHLLTLGLGDAAADGDQHAAAGAGFLFLQQAQPAHFRIDLLGRLLADVAGVEDHQVGVFRRIGRLIAQRRQNVGHARRVIDVHLAAIGLDMQPLLRHESILKNYGRGT